MKLSLVRFSDNGESTLGILLIDGEFFCYTIEDAHQHVKIYGKTRIPEGVYRLSQLKYMTPKTARYRRRFPWFEWHIQIENVPNFKGIYLHIGNDADDSRGCVLVGNRQDANVDDTGFIHNSRVTFQKLYEKIYSRLDREESSIEVINLSNLLTRQDEVR